MAERIANLTPDILNPILDAWVESLPRQADGDRNMDTLRWILLGDPQAVWYHGPSERSFIYIRDLTPGQSASFHALNTDPAPDVKKSKSIVREIMDEHDLHRLHALIPSPLLNVIGYAKKLGFVAEGRMREAVEFDNEKVDLEILGLLRKEVAPLEQGHKRPRRRRSRRKRRS